MKIILENLTKQFTGGAYGVKDVNLEMKDGEFVALLGPSGCGKTTTLLMIAGIYRPTSGSIKFDEKIMNRVLPKHRHIGMVFQSYALYPHMTVFENISYPLKLKKLSKTDCTARVQKVATMMQIDQLLKRKPGQLSGGQQQRVALCRALVKEPEVLLFDEPLSNLDAKLRMRMRIDIKRLQMELGITSVYVTHDQVEAMTMANRIAVMKQGGLQAYDTPDALYDHPKTLFVAEFIGSPQMNFLPVTFGQRNDSFSIQGEGLDLDIPQKIGSLASRNKAPTDLLMGIRPEDVSIDASGQVSAEIYMVEPLGREDLVTLNISERIQIQALVPTNIKVTIGKRVTLRLNLDKLHLFDPSTEYSVL
ncbi:sugar ABC transporter ATP-binding protein [candidate division KSB3 bacterium]|uniref:Sugar ABC transporter ATP-binding protein n=1 Tax=candidate division KSB3 bacterium TaxID=2044937 RepID=A0A2G6KF59_9BACT|nr:MAG: sugar ABC transporter ATP-binding protein [candidate division KSB3 bacterium]